MDEFYSMGKDEAPENIPMMVITFPSAKDPTSQVRHPGNVLCYSLKVLGKQEQANIMNILLTR